MTFPQITYPNIHVNSMHQRRAPSFLVVVSTLIGAMAIAFVAVYDWDRSSTTSRAPAVAGIGLERPFIVVDGTAAEVRVVTTINGNEVDAFTPANLPAVVAIQAESSDNRVKVVVENTGRSGTTSCAIGAEQNLLVSTTSEHASDAVCVATISTATATR